MKRITTPTLLGSLVGSLLLIVGVIAFVVPEKVAPLPAATRLAIAVLLVALPLTALAACAILAWRFMKRIGAQKFILLCGAVVFVLFGLFPPWLKTIHLSATSTTIGVHSERSAGYAFILTPPNLQGAGAASGIRLDTSRLLVEWACTLAATGAGWVMFIPRKPAKEQRKESNDPLALN